MSKQTPVKDKELQAQVDRAMDKFDAHREAAKLVQGCLARETRRDLLIARGIARASRGRVYNRFFL